MKLPAPRAAEKQPDATAAEFVGRRVVVAKSSCRGLRGLSGLVVNESKNAFVLETPKGRKTVPKKGSAFDFGGILVQGDAIMHAPWDRLKKVKRQK
ncbi:hypothetical protein AUJ16_01885 [Candidatus Micrarchaeota archaeon CG1_02_60_51]|nr:MAG: hypothetical protein AUJ16_01885 [Candidatus Micrarchaeota archaeon CG1_02_60_51]